MNTKIGLLCLSLCFAAAISMSIKDSIDDRWKDYKNNFYKTYASEEEPIRKTNFEKNVEKINLNNEKFEKGEVAYKMVINSLTDMDPADYNKMQTERGQSMFNVAFEYPPTYDWRINETVSPVQNMEGCNRSDWAFAAVGMLEGYLHKKKKAEMWLSVQELIDCSDEKGNVGCEGGNVRNAFDYIQENGLSMDNSYPFNATDNKCNDPRSQDEITKNLKITPHPIKPESEGDIKYYISSKSPITATIPCWKEFLEHKEEIFTKDKDCETIDDVVGDYNVLIVGYGETESQKYWIVKNWMGEKWGENGYARVARDWDSYKVFREVVGIAEEVV